AAASMLDARRGEDGPVFCKRHCRLAGLPPGSDATVAIPYPSTRHPNSPAAPAYVDWQAPQGGDRLDTETTAILTGFKDLCPVDGAKRDRLEMCRIWIDASDPLWPRRGRCLRNATARVRPFWFSAC